MNCEVIGARTVEPAGGLDAVSGLDAVIELRGTGGALLAYPCERSLAAKVRIGQRVRLDLVVRPKAEGDAADAE